METTIKIPEKLIPQIEEAAQYEGYNETEGYILHIIQEKLTELSNWMRIMEITDRVRDSLEDKGISGEDLQEEFDRFRNKLKDE